MSPKDSQDGQDHLLVDLLTGDGPSPDLLARYAENPASLSQEERSEVEEAAVHSRAIADQLRVLESFDPSALEEAAQLGHGPTPASSETEAAGWLAPLRRFAEALKAPPAVWAPAVAALVLLLALVSWRALEDTARVESLESELAATQRSLQVLKQDLARVSESSSLESQQLAQLRGQLHASRAELAAQREAAATGPEAELAPPPETPSPPSAETLAATPAPQPTRPKQNSVPPKRATAPPDPAATPPAVVVAMNEPLVYQAPAGMDAQAPSRSSALMRSPAAGLPEVVALAPDHVGLTVSASPALAWRLSSRTDRPLVVTVVDPERQQTLLDTKLKGPQRRGYGRLSLSQQRVSLEAGRTYQWFVSVLAGDASGPDDPVASGLIERVRKTPQLEADLRRAGSAGATHAYAKHGIWYDAIDALSRQIVRLPKSKALRDQREDLLKQVGLPEASKN